MQKHVFTFMSAFALSIFAVPANAAIDFSSTPAMQTTCAELRPRTAATLRADDEKVAYVICSGIDLLTDTARWARSMSKRMESSNAQERDRSFVQAIRVKLEEILVRITAARQALSTVRANKPLFVIKPGEWEIDLDGDGTVTPFEKHFFWVARRGNDQIAAFSGTGGTAEYYGKHFVKPVIKLDQSDVYWAAAYLNFAEAALNLVLSYNLDPQSKDVVVLHDEKRVATKAYPRLLEGIATSRKLRESLLKETDNDHEWIANPKQTNTSFPLVMDAQSFATWDALLEHMDSLFRGKTLLGGATAASRPGDPQPWRTRDLTMGLCRPGEGINVRDLFLRPLKRPLDAVERSARCVKPTTAVPFTGLGKLIEESLRRNAERTPDNQTGEWMVLRHLYWVN
jgi:hypothetical protein